MLCSFLEGIARIEGIVLDLRSPCGTGTYIIEIPLFDGLQKRRACINVYMSTEMMEIVTKV